MSFPLGMHVIGFRVSAFWRGVIQLGAWCVALAWVLRTYDALRGIPGLPNLTLPKWDTMPEGLPTLTVVVPGRDEAANIGATLDALLQTDYEGMKILVIDDRSNDGTAEIVDSYYAACARQWEGRLDAIHISDLPEGWLGKTFALMVATENSDSEYLLFTDADVLFSPSILRRALVYAKASAADHLVVLPTMQVRSRGEGIVLGFFQVLGLWASRLWKVEDAKATRDVVGVGAFNLVRREALNEIGGWLPQRLAVLEDITLGRRMKAAGMRQRIAFAPGLVLVHWAKGARGLLVGMTKNLFSAFGFNPLLVLMACLWIGVFCLLPLAGFAWLPTVLPALAILCCVAALYRVMGEVSQIDARYGWLYPLGAVGMMLAMLRSMVVVLVQRGVVWRGTHYPLRDLRRHNSPFVWEREARKRRDAMAMAKRAVKKSGKGRMG
ncbi:MAG: glycosyltransferase [Acidobacteria bacterium]|nr:glycosyltransferase [Acidobacteriota bacterium]